VIGELVEASFVPTERLNVSVEVDLIGALTVAAVTNPALAGIFPGAPLHQRGFPDPGAAIVLRDAGRLEYVRAICRP
jgi:hypothetical protein